MAGQTGGCHSPSPALLCPVSFPFILLPSPPASLSHSISSPQSWTGAALCSTQNTDVYFKSGGKRAKVEVLPTSLRGFICRRAMSVTAGMEQSWGGSSECRGTRLTPIPAEGEHWRRNNHPGSWIFHLNHEFFSSLYLCMQRTALIILLVR